MVASPDQWVDQYGDYLYRYANSRLQDSTAAEDAVQETFLAGIRFFNRYSGTGSQRGWLMGILKRKIIDVMRSRAKLERYTSLEEQGDPTAVLFDEHGRWKQGVLPVLAPDQQVESNELWQVVRKCLASIPQTQADVFVLSVMEEMGTEQICDALEISPTNLWVRLHRARLGLAKCVGSKWFLSGERSTENE